MALMLRMLTTTWQKNLKEKKGDPSLALQLRPDSTASLGPLLSDARPWSAALSTDGETQLEAAPAEIPPIVLAAFAGNLDGVKAELRKRVSIEIPGTEAHMTPLIAAASNAEHGNRKVVTHLLDQGANIDATARDGNTALMMAASNGRLKLVKLLVTRGAKLQMQNNACQTALSLAREAGHTQMVAFLEGEIRKQEEAQK